jgi:hypothetical protein
MMGFFSDLADSWYEATGMGKSPEVRAAETLVRSQQEKLYRGLMAIPADRWTRVVANGKSGSKTKFVVYAATTDKGARVSASWSYEAPFVDPDREFYVVSVDGVVCLEYTHYHGGWDSLNDWQKEVIVGDARACNIFRRARECASTRDGSEREAIRASIARQEKERQLQELRRDHGHLGDAIGRL